MKKTISALMLLVLLCLCACGQADIAPADAGTSVTGAEAGLAAALDEATAEPTAAPTTEVTAAPTAQPTASDAASSTGTSRPAAAAKPPIHAAAAKTQKFSAPAVGANDFAFRLGCALLAKNGNKNFVSSPYSVWLPLAALVNATNSSQKPVLLNALGAAGFSEKELNDATAQALYSLTDQRKKELGSTYFHNPLHIANAIFVDKSATLNQNFKKIFAESYLGSAQTVSFSSPDALKTINDWAEKNTGGLIKNILDTISPDAVAVIANAIYFSDRWEKEFNSEQTEQGKFNGTNGKTDAHFMLREGSGSYYEDEKLQAMPLTFQTGGTLHILLPKNGSANSLLSSMTLDYFEKIQRDASQAKGTLLLPRFSIDSGEMKLIDVLAALGIPLVDSSLSPLDGLTGEGALYISDALQKAVIKVDEKGTTAAAVTAMTMKYGMAPSPQAGPFRMVCDKPFAFILCGSGGQILFTGVVNQI